MTMLETLTLWWSYWLVGKPFCNDRSWSAETLTERAP